MIWQPAHDTKLLIRKTAAAAPVTFFICRGPSVTYRYFVSTYTTQENMNNYFGNKVDQEPVA